MNCPRRNENLVNNIGILSTDTWQYYKRTFGCLNFKGTGIENNYYLLRPIHLNSGERVNTNRKFLLAQQQSPLFEGLGSSFQINLTLLLQQNYFICHSLSGLRKELRSCGSTT